VVGLQIDYAEAGVPEQYYVADYFRVSFSGSDALFVFGKLDSPSKTTLRNKLEVYFPAHMFVLQLWDSSRDFHEKLRKFVSETKTQGSGAAAENISEQTAPNMVRTFHSNNVMMALGGGETILDFFYISPKELWVRPKRNESIPLEPLVRVLLEPQNLLALLDRSGELLPDIRRHVHPSFLGEAVQE
jgi:hypothetical protein